MTAPTISATPKKALDQRATSRHDNVLRQALSIKDFTTPVLLPGITVNTSPTNYVPIRQFQLQRFNGENWELFGDVLSD